MTEYGAAVVKNVRYIIRNHIRLYGRNSVARVLVHPVAYKYLRAELLRRFEGRLEVEPIDPDFTMLGVVVQSCPWTWEPVIVPPENWKERIYEGALEPVSGEHKTCLVIDETCEPNK